MVLVPPTTGGPAALSADTRELMELQTLPGNYTQGPPQARAPALLSAPPDSPALPLGTFPVPLSKLHVSSLTADSSGSLISIYIILW